MLATQSSLNSGESETNDLPTQEQQQVLKGARTNSLEEMYPPRNKKHQETWESKKIDDMT